MSISTPRPTHKNSGGDRQKTVRPQVRAAKRAHPVEWGMALFIIVLLVLALVYWMSAPATSLDASTTIRITHGDTLWDIAAQHRLPGLTTAETVAVIREANGMSSSSLAVGDTLAIPVAIDHGPLLAIR